MWNSILSIINLPNSLPLFSRIIGRYFDTSLGFSFPGLIAGIITESFQFLEKHPFFRHKYICVENKGKTWRAPITMSLVTPSCPGDFFEFFFNSSYFFLRKNFIVSRVYWLLNFLPNFSI